MMDDNDEYEIITPSSNAANSMMAVVTKAEIDQQISTAKQYPRSIKQFISDATEMCTLNEAIAESCNYGLPRGGKIIEGASVRFAEIVLSAWGNCRAGARIVHEDARFITAQGICHDLQTNTMITMEVQRKITDKNGRTYKDDMVGVTGNAAASIALRNAILRKVPKAFWEPIYMKSRDVALGVSKPMANRRADALAVMQKFGVTQEMIFAKFEIKGIEDLTIEHLSQLHAAKVSIKEGIVTAEAFFAVPKPVDETKGNEAVKTQLKEGAGKKKKPTKEENAVAAGADPKTGELPPDKKPETESQSFPDKGKTEKEPPQTEDEIATKFAADCAKRKNITDMVMLRADNRLFLESLQVKNPPKYNWCVAAYNECMIALGANEGAMMEEI